MYDLNNLEYDMSDTQKTMTNGGPVYMFSNENIAEPISCAGGLQNKNVLTVASSGDHAFEAYLAGARHVDTFDFNVLQQNVMNLKTYAIRNLSFNDFLRAFSPGPNMLHFESKHLARMTPDMHELINLYKQKQYGIFRESDYDLYEYSTAYYNDQYKYQKLQKLLPEKINFTHCDIRELPDRFHKTYDVIILSNIFSYVYGTQNEKNMLRMYKEILLPLVKNNLTQTGYICVQYNWDYAQNDQCVYKWKNCVDALNRTISENGHYFEMVYVMSNRQNCDTDLITVMKQQYQKTK